MLNPRQVLLVTALLLAVGVQRVSAGEVWSGKVVAVADGDTITVLRDKTEVKIRLHGVDAPEKAQPFGEKAKQHTSGLVFGKEVRVEVVTRDKYGRTVARVLYRPVRGAESCLNEELVKAGLAWWYRQYSLKDKKLAQLEEEAKKAKRGLWADASPTPPWEYRHPDLVCRKDADCVFLPSICPECAPCKPTPRRFGNQEALGRIHSMQARVRCALPKCPPCADEKNRIGGNLTCTDGRCALARAATPATAPPAASTRSGPYHGNVRSKVLHGPGCADYACKKCTVGFKTVEEAKQAGYRLHACAAAFEKCYSECSKRNMAKAMAWEAIEAECRQSCARR